MSLDSSLQLTFVILVVVLRIIIVVLIIIMTHKLNIHVYSPKCLTRVVDEDFSLLCLY